MKWLMGLGALVALMAFGAAAPVGAQDAAELKVGDKAPEFKLVGTDGKTYSLKDFAGKSAVVLAWYPKALTRGCTLECKSLRDSKDELAKYKVAYFGASVDPLDLNKQFIQENSLNFTLLSDPDKSYAKAVGVLNAERGVANRWTFIIDDKGVIRDIDKMVQPPTHGADLVKKLDALGIPKK
jgi:peroxiredoxin Q/BCP